MNDPSAPSVPTPRPDPDGFSPIWVHPTDLFGWVASCRACHVSTCCPGEDVARRWARAHRDSLKHVEALAALLPAGVD